MIDNEQLWDIVNINIAGGSYLLQSHTLTLCVCVCVQAEPLSLFWSHFSSSPYVCLLFSFELRLLKVKIIWWTKEVDTENGVVPNISLENSHFESEQQKTKSKDNQLSSTSFYHFLLYFY